MREIKFRAYVMATGEIDLVTQITFEECWLKIATSDDWRMFNEVELMQYTSLKDKNGVEIYEGDVVEYTGTDPYEDPSCCSVVEYDEDEFVCFDAGLSSCYYEVEVIGDKFQNPELLEEVE